MRVTAIAGQCADPATSTASGMVWIPAGRFTMGSDRHYPEEAPAHGVAVDGFFIDRTPVTNRAFADFVAATGHVTLAERAPRPEDYPGADPRLLVPGSLVFTAPKEAGGREDWTRWWRFMPGADWRHPQGPGSDLSGREDHPVVHVCHDDALAYARWCGKELPSEAEWEFAARGGLDGMDFAWGEELAPGGVHRANSWQGAFPHENLAEDGYVATSPVTAFPPNGFGLHDMIGNVWEWTDDWYAPRHAALLPSTKPCCLPRNPRGARWEESVDPLAPGGPAPRKVLKGGSHLCAPSYCRRYRPAARQPQTVDTASVHIGFRCIRRATTL
ncbi:formylglycine-generating enzyme family protein [Ancylobacter rudongensis]|uniref:Formylglycine-generating enzyme, required for sulfatase activity, contains SUMF1/FGE domain n=1 Tax=Ancylobacter rudongensis TaxID=177413 RepID=A0A1G4T0N0_9HYPH|nr:formylglycine-generating enzyme family protein [Ancylobacter rudongensis]SCW74099.1 Formylglycine-generating enzyme, required for sulfatase activity, contains SUMF1/FGE domain [Ancylobacter rudongensis]